MLKFQTTATGVNLEYEGDLGVASRMIVRTLDE